MADVRPLHGLRYQAAAGDIGDLIAPPYDVISDEAQRALYARSPYNVVRLEYGTEPADGEANRYQAAAESLARWRRQGVVALDPRASFYLYEQEFEHDRRRYRRRSIIGRVRLQPWEDGAIRPHEHTMSAPKQDRLRLLRACRTDISPVFALYRSDGGAAVAICEAASAGGAPVEARDATGQVHRLWTVNEPLAVQRLELHFSRRTLYIADGHHRYETALAYRDERRAAENQWSDDEPENFVLMALTAADDPGLLVLPIHRLVRPLRQPADLFRALEPSFDVQAWPAPGEDGSVAALVEQLRRAGADRPAFAVLGSRAALARLRDEEAVQSLMPAGHAEAWRSLSVNVLQYGILEPLLGIDLNAVRDDDRVQFTESAEAAWQAVATGHVPLAFLLNATRPEEIFAVADAGERMPQKSTFFYPKLGTGLVLYALDAHLASGAPAR